MDGALISETLLPDYPASQSTRYLKMLFFPLVNNAVKCHHYIRLVTHQWVCSTAQSTGYKNLSLSLSHLVQHRWPGWIPVFAVSGQRPTSRLTDIPIFLLYLIKYLFLRLHSLHHSCTKEILVSPCFQNLNSNNDAAVLRSGVAASPNKQKHSTVGPTNKMM
jgi:hypothetical protein